MLRRAAFPFTTTTTTTRVTRLSTPYNFTTRRVHRKGVWNRLGAQAMSHIIFPHIDRLPEAESRWTAISSSSSAKHDPPHSSRIISNLRKGGKSQPRGENTARGRPNSSTTGLRRGLAASPMGLRRESIHRQDLALLHPAETKLSRAHNIGPIHRQCRRLQLGPRSYDRFTAFRSRFWRPRGILNVSVYE